MVGGNKIPSKLTKVVKKGGRRIVPTVRSDTKAELNNTANNNESKRKVPRPIESLLQRVGISERKRKPVDSRKVRAMLNDLRTQYDSTKK